MTTPHLIRLIFVLAVMAFTANSQALPVLGCNAASQTHVNCADIFGGTMTGSGINFYTVTEYHVGYRRGLENGSTFMDSAISVARHDVFATSTLGLALAEQGGGSTLVVEFGYDAALTGLVLSLGTQNPAKGDGMRSERMALTGQVVTYDANGEKLFDQVVEGESGYVYVNFGNLASDISTLLISSGGGLSGLTSTDTNVTYFITALPEPGTLWLLITGFGALVLRRRLL